MEGFVVIRIDKSGRASLSINQVEADAISAACDALKKGAAQAAVVPGRLFGDFRFQIPDAE